MWVMRRILLKPVLYVLAYTALFIFMVLPQYPRFIKVVTGITTSGFSDGIGTVVSKSEDCNIGVKSVTADGKELMLELDDEDCSSVINDKVEFIYESDNPQCGYLNELPTLIRFLFCWSVYMWIIVLSNIFLIGDFRVALKLLTAVALLLFYFSFSSQYPRFVKGGTGITLSGFSDLTGTVVFKLQKENNICYLEVKSVTQTGKEQITEINDESCSVEIYDEVKFIYKSDNPRHGYLAELSPSQIKAIKRPVFWVIFLLLHGFFLNKIYKKENYK